MVFTMWDVLVLWYRSTQLQRTGCIKRLGDSSWSLRSLIAPLLIWSGMNLTRMDWFSLCVLRNSSGTKQPNLLCCEKEQIERKLFSCICGFRSSRMFFRCKICVSSEDRMRNGCKKIMKSRQGSTQGRLDTFFTVTGSISSKRKVGGSNY